MNKPLIPSPVTGQCLQVLSFLRQHEELVYLTLTADNAIHEAAVPVSYLRAKGFNVITTIQMVL